MARNQEKANSMLNRWVAFKKDEASGGRLSAKRPSLASMVDKVSDCERWRMQILRQVGKLIMTIQNESLGEQRIRDLNDEINKLLREKSHWERRIVELGGPNYRKFERIQDEKALAESGVGMATPGGATPADLNPDAPDHPGHVYKYFGAARNLPGVRELFRQREELKRARYDGKAADAAYYGFRDDDDGELELSERQHEARAIAQAVAAEAPDPLGDDEAAAAAAAAVREAASAELVSSMPVPSKEQMEQFLVKKRQEELLKKYVSANYIQEIEQSKSEIEVVLGKRKAV
eukprot:TRINITY_DN5223_c0_g1_i1.p2 TRINITY_DN5223_c0_g1~~TRINITY_DN5223_c0_g1_i1.p2  ORF type:complete len:291 (-),score=130.10 TRINITY_DN5223_c0_g1_i1:39-911(-)